MSFHIESIPNQANKPAILLRQAWREGKRIRKKTLSKLPPDVVDGFRIVLKGGLAVRDPSDLLRVERSWAHGHVAAVLGTCRQLGFERILHRRRQRWIETSLANRHLTDATLILYDVSSSYLEGRLCPLAAFGYNRDGKQGKQQIVFGLLCSADGCPLAVEVFPGNTADPTTVGPQVERIRKRFGIARIALVGDRGMLTTARIRADLAPAGLDWISALKTQHLRKLLKQPKPAPGQDPAAVKAPLRPNGTEIAQTEFGFLRRPPVY